MEQPIGGRIPPHHEVAEKSVLGSMLQDHQAVLLAQELLHEDDFYDPANREIFSAMLHLSAMSRPVDLVTVDEELTRRGLTIYPGEANFLLFRSQDEALHDKLAARGVLIRNCANYRGLGAGYYRVAVKTREDTARLLAALDSIQEG